MAARVLTAVPVVAIPAVRAGAQAAVRAMAVMAAGARARLANQGFSGGPLAVLSAFTLLLRIWLCIEAVKENRKEKPDQGGDEVEKELHAHRCAGEPCDGDGDSQEEVKTAWQRRSSFRQLP